MIYIKSSAIKVNLLHYMVNITYSSYTHIRHPPKPAKISAKADNRVASNELKTGEITVHLHLTCSTIGLPGSKVKPGWQVSA